MDVRCDNMRVNCFRLHTNKRRTFGWFGSQTGAVLTVGEREEYDIFGIVGTADSEGINGLQPIFRFTNTTNISKRSLADMPQIVLAQAACGWTYPKSYAIENFYHYGKVMNVMICYGTAIYALQFMYSGEVPGICLGSIQPSSNRKILNLSNNTFNYFKLIFENIRVLLF